MRYYNLGRASLIVFVASLGISFLVGLFYIHFVGEPGLFATYLLELTISLTVSLAVLSREDFIRDYPKQKQLLLVLLVGIAAPVVGAVAFLLSAVKMLRK